MGKLKVFEISFANGSGVYYPGNAVDGHVTVELKEPMNMRGIQLQFEGTAYVHWSESLSSESGYYSATENYFFHEDLLFGIWPKQGSETKELPLGRHTFPFQFILPLGLPSSFEAGIGHVRYTVSCNIDKPWKIDHTTTRPFTVIALLDLNQHPDCMLNVDISGLGLDLNIPLGIIIGSIPHVSVAHMYQPKLSSPQTIALGTASSPPATASSPPATEVLHPNPLTSGVPSSPPFSYGESIIGRYKMTEGDNEYTFTRGKLEYAPVYPYYNF